MLPLLIGSVFVASYAFAPARGQFTGQVCIVFPTTSTTCPTSSPTIGPVSVGQTITVGIFVQGSDAMGGFDIYVQSNPAVLGPVSAALGTLIASPSLTSICINGSAQTGSCTVGTANGAGVVEITTIESTGTNECGGIGPCSGLAATITYNVVGASSSTTLAYPSAAGCGNTSVAASTECVLVADAFGAALPETIQTPAATVTQVTQQGVCITYPSTMASCPVGEPTYTPFSAGQIFTVGVFAQDSAPVGGFDVYVSVDGHFLQPLNASLGTLITSPSLTNICVNGAALTGACTPNSANGPNVVEVSTIESSGTNDGTTGLLFTVTFIVVHATPNTEIVYPANPACAVSSAASPANKCVLVTDAFGTTLSEGIQGAFIGAPHGIDATALLIVCGSPTLVSQLNPTTCTATINDTAASGRVSALGGVKWSTDGIGAFNPNVCEAQQQGNGPLASCSVQYFPLGVGTGTTHITGIFDTNTIEHDPTHTGSTGSFTMTVVAASPVLSTGVIVDQNGLPPPAGAVQTGQSVHDVANMVPGSGFPVQGVSGSVQYRLFANSGCTGTVFTVEGTFAVLANNNVPPSSSSGPLAAGGYGFSAVYTPNTADNTPVTSACEPFTVTAYPGFTSGKLHWTHHLSLSKSANVQSWTAIVNDPLSVGVQVVVRIIGSSAINPSLTFDIVCGVVCVNTPRAGVNAINATQVGLISVGAGATVSFSFSQSINTAFANNKVTFTATVFWTSNGVDFTQGTSKSGAFAVVP